MYGSQKRNFTAISTNIKGKIFKLYSFCNLSILLLFSYFSFSFIWSVLSYLRLTLFFILDYTHYKFDIILLIHMKIKTLSKEEF